MRLRALRVHGFKSFADPTEIEFHEGITAIVGPNGCGKSNISDAIRWVLGEQRPTAIRGARMEEAIFQGTVSRRPVGRASVSLRVSNEGGTLPVPFEEVELGRTVYRDGGSDYSINRSTCRLRDVLDLCRDTGLGANAYAVIENRMIDAILSDRAEERRALFEEAAGIGKYKDRRKAALRRLERAELDLQRVDDIIAEVETKVRSLARQKGKAQRYQSLRDRRLAVEMAVVRRQLDELQERLRKVGRELAGDRELGEGYLAELRALETQVETLRLRQGEAERSRGEAAREVERIRGELVRWERELAVAGERSVYAGRRLQQIEAERTATLAQMTSLQGEEESLRAAEAAAGAALDARRHEQEERVRLARGAREALEVARKELGEEESRLRELGRGEAQLEGEAASSEAQAAELERALERLRREMRDASKALSDLESQGDLFADQLSRSREALELARGGVAAAQGESRGLREALEGAREEEARAREAAAGVEARLGALEGMERSQEGVEPAVRQALSLGDPGILGTLGDAISGEPEVIRAVETFLGPLVQGLVVRDEEAVVRLQRWHAEVLGGRGGLILLPLDRLPPGEGGEGGSLLASLRLRGEGAPWVRALLGEVHLMDSGALLEAPPGRVALTRAGEVRERLGVVRLGNPLRSSGILERRERMARLEEELREARGHLAESRERREGAEEEARRGEGALEEAWEALREAEDAFRAASAQVEAQSDRRGRLGRHQEDLARQVEGTRAARARALDRGAAAREDAGLLAQEAGVLRGAGEAARVRVLEAQADWEEAGSEASRLAVEVTRQEGEWSRLRERLREVEGKLDQAGSREAALQAEEGELRGELERSEGLRAEGSAATGTLFGLRDREEEELRRREEVLARVNESLQEAEERLRAARVAERDALGRRHKLELEERDISGQVGRIQERLEGEWGRPLEVLLAEAEPVEGDPEELREELREIVETLERLGPVNMLAMEEHQEESARLEFLHKQRADLREARDGLRTAIRQINETATRLFQETFQQIRENFRSTFLRLFEGGEADLRLEDEEDPLESVIEIHASPRGQRTQRIDLLSGGERALTALSLLFGIYLVKPSPFCVFDEVDAPLDESNIYRFIRLLQEFKGQTQFVIITHNARTIEAADWIYGVTMEEPGVSRVVGVRLEDAIAASGSAA